MIENNQKKEEHVENASEQIPIGPEQINIPATMPRKSRLSKGFQKKSRNTLVLSILAIIVILFLLFRYGLPIISDASFLFGRVTSSEESTNENKDEKEKFVPIPNLDPLPKATNENTIKISGTSLSGLKVNIYLNGTKVDGVLVDNNGDFESELSLTDGENIIKAKALKKESESDFSDSVVIIYKKKGTDVTIESPSDGAQIGKNDNPVEVKGKSDPDSNVLVNDFQAIINSSGDWSYMLTLKGGDNEIKVVSTDAAGNKTEKIIHVNYSE